MWQNIGLNSFLIVVFDIGICLTSNYGKDCIIEFKLYVGWEQCPTTMNHLSFDTMHFRYAISFKGRNVGLEGNVRGQLRKMMKHYRGFKSRQCDKYMLSVK
jgi:hypothetical protein